MGRRNSTSVPDFILLGLADSAEAQLLLFLLFLLIYLVTVLRNTGMMLLIRLDAQLHTPMYFFLTHLSFLDLSYSSVITPRTLQNLLASSKSISFLGCFTQLYFFILFGATECFLLSSMAIDRYVAICSPLHYPVIMSTRQCRALLAGSYMIGFVDSTLNVVWMSRLHFCKSHIIHHFFCDTSPILSLSCSDTYNVEIILFICAGSTLIASLITIAGSYVSILSTILKINSTAGKKKAFSTCASHLLGVTIFYSTMIFTYLKPKQSYSLGKDQVASVFYTIVIPMLNPLIYSLRNKEVKHAVLRILQKQKSERLHRFQHPSLFSIAFLVPDLNVYPCDWSPLAHREYHQKWDPMFLPILDGIAKAGGLTMGRRALGLGQSQCAQLNNQIIVDFGSIKDPMDTLEVQIDSLATVIPQNQKALNLLTSQHEGT
ncbi:PREDICTED: olfactory receptor 8H1-like [Chinchilla lanigera]|uniref:olfactory receptor 8H1-like n=1 Tax=Chinchilla lanigera TaxID=34839 RepID=UPI0006980D1D|nr:PREDICTED: olfactory receptor 8H1-like [Chinchilla lanigera]